MTWLSHDHNGFEATVYKCRTLCDARNLDALRDTFRTFVASYETHVRMEEEVLFPSYEKREGAPRDPTESLRADHTQIFRLMKRIGNQIEQGERDAVADDLALLYRVLTVHHEKEEKVFLPMASELLAEDKDTVLSALAGGRAG